MGRLLNGAAWLLQQPAAWTILLLMVVGVAFPLMEAWDAWELRKRALDGRGAMDNTDLGRFGDVIALFFITLDWCHTKVNREDLERPRGSEAQSNHSDRNAA